MPTRRVVGVLVLVLAAGGGLAACGDDGPAAVDLDEYADTWCDAYDDYDEQHDDGFGDAFQTLSDGVFVEDALDDDEVEDLLDDVRAAFDDEEEALEAFRDEVASSAPDDGDADAWLDALEGYFDDVAAAAAEAREGFDELEVDDVLDDPEDVRDLVTAMTDPFGDLFFEDPDDPEPHGDYPDIAESVLQECFA